MSASIAMTWPQYRQRCCTFHGRTVRLSPMLTELLSTLLARRGQLVSRAELIETLWPVADREPDGAERCLHSRLWQLRKLLPGIIHNEHGLGWMIELPAAVSDLRMAA